VIQALRRWEVLVAAFACTGASADWPNYNNGYDGQRYSSLKQIDTANVAHLKPVCQAELSDPGTFQSGPLVIGRLLYVTTSHTTVAIKADDCSIIWEHAYKPEANEIQLVNRGLGYADGRLFRGTPDGRVLALDASTGKELWRVEPASEDGSLPNIANIASAPVAWNGLVFVGLGGGDWGQRGRMLALDAQTGATQWQFNLVPEKGEPGYETWKIPETAEHGGGSTWSSYALDPQAGEIFIPVGNAAPMFDPDSRPGDNLYTSSIVVLNARTGKLNWYYQFLPNEGLDYDVAAAPMLYSAPDGRRMVAVGSKDGHLYGLDRDTHQLVYHTAVTTVMEPQPRPTPEGVRVCPGFVGGVEWNGPAFDPPDARLYTGSVDYCNIAKTGKDDYQRGRLWHGTMADISTAPADLKDQGWVVATSAGDGGVIWRYHADSPVIAAVTPTAGELVFIGTVAGDFLALDGASGKPLYIYKPGGALAGGIITYMQGGKQYVTITSGNVSRGPFFAMAGIPKVTVMALNAVGPPRQIKVKNEFVPNFGGFKMSEHYRTYAGKKYYMEFCASCHGSNGDGGVGPALRGATESTRHDKRPLAEVIKNPSGATMPHFYPKTLRDSDVQQLVLFLSEWK
jgi:alcohol dehydrogenase (cytochrome c)